MQSVSPNSRFDVFGKAPLSSGRAFAVRVSLLFVGLAVFLAGCSGGDGETTTEVESATGGSTSVVGQSTTAPASTTTTKTRPTDEVVGIRTPSGNIHCDALIYGPKDTDAQMRCFIKEMSGPDLPRPAWAECDWEGGRLFGLGSQSPGSRSSFCDALGARARPVVTLAYGSAWRHGPYTCLSSRLGLLCTNSEGHGLFLSRDRQEGF